MSESIGFRGGLGSLSGGTLGQVLVRVGIDTKQLDAGMAKAKADATTAGTTVSKFGQFAQAGFALAGIAAVKFAADAVKAADDHEQALVLLKQAVGGTTEAYESQANALQALTGFQDEEILRADTTLARFKLTREEIQRTVPLLLDWARATGESASTAAVALGRALLGNTRGLKSIGIQFTATGDKAKDLATILKQLESRVGGTAKEFGQTFAGKLEIVNAKFDDIKEGVGAALIPVLERLLDLGSSLADVFGPLAVQVFTELGQTAGELADPLGLVVQGFTDLVHSTDEAAGTTSGFADTWHMLSSLNPVHWLAEYNAWLLKTAGVTKTVAIESAVYTGTLQDLLDALPPAAGATKDLAQAQRDAADAAREQHAAMKALAGGTVGLLASLDQLRSAQRDLNAARADTTTTTAELRAAELNVLQAQLGVTGSFKDLVDKQRDAGASSEEIINKFSAMATKAGLTKSEIQSLTQFIQGYIDKLKAIPTSVVTHITTVHGHDWQTGGGFASGTSFFPGGVGLVGERGPELVSLPRGSSIMPADRTRRALERGGGMTINIISPTDPAQAIVDNLGAWQRANRDWIS